MITRNETLFSEWKKWIIFLLMFLVFAGIGFVSYEKVLSAPFLYDDIHLILENINIRELGNIWYVINYNRPLISFSYAVNFAMRSWFFSWFSAYSDFSGSAMGRPSAVFRRA